MPPAAKGEVAAAVEAAAAASISLNGNSKIDVWVSPLQPELQFRLRAVSRYALLAAQEKLREPEIPVVFIAEKDRSEENPNHPAYVSAMREYNLSVSLAIVDTYLALGTSLLSKPADMEGPEGGEWIERLEVLGVVVPTDKKFVRYLMWLKLSALSDDESTSLIRACQRFNGLTIEDDVEAALDGLKSDEERDSDSSVTAAQERGAD